MNIPSTDASVIAGHAVHWLNWLAAAALEKRPRGHGRHEPMESENRPTSHPTHPSFLPTPVSARVCVPAGHCVHVLEAFAPIVSEYFPDAHSLHVSAPASSTYLKVVNMKFSVKVSVSVVKKINFQCFHHTLNVII